MSSLPAASDPTILASKRAIYVGGLADGVTPQLLRAALVPFGPIKSLDMVSSLRSKDLCHRTTIQIFL